MTTAGPNNPGTVADDATVGTISWLSASNAVSSNNSYATCTSGGVTSGHYLLCTNYGFALPSDATVTGITFSAERKGNASNSISTNAFRHVRAGVIDATNLAEIGGNWATSDEVVDYTGLGDGGWLYSDINSSGFGCALSPHFDTAGTASIDVITCTITYTTVSITATGTLIETTISVTRESHIVAGGRTLILTVANDTWVSSGATFDAQRQNIINGLDSAQAEAHGWDVEVKANLATSTVVRTSNTVVTITLSAQAAYNITVKEIITCIVPATALTGAGAITASPTFRVVPDYNRITHLGGLGIGAEPPARKLCATRAGNVPGHWKDVRPR